MKVIADLKKCGAGSAQCCIFLTCGPTGVLCGREDPALKQLLMRKAPGMKASRIPVEAFPSCQLKALDNKEEE